LSKYPGLPLGVGQFSYAVVPNACRTSDASVLARDGLRERVTRVRALLRNACAQSTIGWDGKLVLERDYHGCHLPGPQAVMGNHEDNAEQQRRFEPGPTTSIVTPGAFFPSFNINFEQADQYLAQATNWNRLSASDM
jgi:hypothetical protein